MSSSPTGPAPPAAVQQHLSRPRLGTYLHACPGDLEAALRLYRWNAAVSAALWEVLGHGEVILRNAMHNELTAHHQRRGDPGEWFDDPQRVFHLRTVNDVRTAKRRAGPGAPPGKVVAELSFGFWRYLLANRYSTTLWPAIRHAFPNLPRRGNTRRIVEGHVDDLHLLRNRIAHHEPLINVPLHARLQSLEYVLDGIDLQIRVWALDDGGRLSALLQSRP
jgi:hypothetical protein